MGASLLAKAGFQSLEMLADPPLSRAGSLPQCFAFQATKKQIRQITGKAKCLHKVWNTII
ncbi:hypothetical protein C0J26_12900 [Pseudomonas baetica]|nr:hypothetical protein C0J26_12900 [Pseudomonas baetica]